MRSYHAKSWSASARKMAENQLEQVLDGEITEKEAIKFFSKSYRNPLIRQRAAKRFGREMRKHNVLK